MNNQQPTDKAGSPRRLKIMKNDHTLYGILAGSEEKGRGAMETAVFATCILSIAAAIFQFIGQPTPDPFAGFDPAAQPSSSCFALRQSSVGDEILNAVSRYIEKERGAALRRVPKPSV